MAQGKSGVHSRSDHPDEDRDLVGQRHVEQGLLRPLPLSHISVVGLVTCSTLLLDLVVVRRFTKSTNMIFFSFLRGLESLQIPKSLRDDLGGGRKEFVLRDVSAECY